MKKIIANSLPIEDIICDIAKALDTECVKNGHEYTLKIPKAIGKGFITGIAIQGGMGIVVYECLFKEDTQIQFLINKVNPLKFLYILSGSIAHCFENDLKYVHKINEYQSAIVASKHKNGHILFFKKDVHTRLHSLEIDRQKFKLKMKGEVRSLNPDMRTLFDDVEATNSFYYVDHYNLELADLFERMYSYIGSDFLRKLYLEGMAYLALIKQLELYDDDQKEEREKSLLRMSEMEKIKKAILYIEDNLIDTPSIPEIAKEVGLSTAKLQYGVKLLYQSSVSEYIQKTRLKVARNLILNTEYNMTEVAMRIGISSKSYFSKIFKENFGISPSTFREKYVSSIKKTK